MQNHSGMHDFSSRLKRLKTFAWHMHIHENCNRVGAWTATFLLPAFACQGSGAGESPAYITDQILMHAGPRATAMDGCLAQNIAHSCRQPHGDNGRVEIWQPFRTSHIGCWLLQVGSEKFRFPDMNTYNSAGSP